MIYKDAVTGVQCPRLGRKVCTIADPTHRHVLDTGRNPRAAKALPGYRCLLCQSAAEHVIDGNTCCGEHYATAWQWAKAKRANR